MSNEINQLQPTPEDRIRWVELSINSAEQAVLETVLLRLVNDVGYSPDFYDLQTDDGRFVYAGSVDLLGRTTVKVGKECSDPASRDICSKLSEAVNTQDNHRRSEQYA